jgi:uncharacterized protein YkwD
MPLRRVLVACCLTAAVMLCGTPSVEASPGLMSKVNGVRKAHRLAPLRVSPALARSSAGYAGRLMQADRFGHASRIRASHRFSRLGEVLAFNRGWTSSASAVVRGWLRSPSHRAALLSPSFRYAGAGVVQGRFGSGKATIWVVHFGRP